MLHRDIKPANVMVFDYLDQKDLVKLLDFGIAKTWSHDTDGNPISEDLTEDGTVMGTPRYMSPEQIVGQRLSPASDIYSLGLLVFEMLCGAPAAPQTQKTEVVRRHLGPEPFVLPNDLAVPPNLRELVARMLSKDIGKRFVSVDDVLAATENWNVAPVPVMARQPEEDMAATQASGAPLGMLRPTEPTPVPAASQQPMRSAHPTQPSNTPQSTSGQQPYFTPQYGSPPQTAPQPVHTGFQAGAAPLPAPLPGALTPQPFPVAKPTRTFVQLSVAPNAFELDVPMKPTKRALMIAGVLGLFALIGFMALPFIFTLLTVAAFAWGLSLVFETHRLRVSPDAGYEVITAVFTYEREKRGPLLSVVRFDVSGTDEDGDTTLSMVTHEGEFTVATGFSTDELRWVANEGNAWLSRVRAANPNPAG
jgi:hypothetical protein